MFPQHFGHLGHVFVAPSGQADQEHLLLRQAWSHFYGLSQGVRRLQRGNHALMARKREKGLQSFLIRDADIFGAALILELGVFPARPRGNPGRRKWNTRTRPRRWRP